MKEKELEDAMMRFVERGADLLLSTTIIENGIDLPNVNTIFINRAHRLGLAQLYQLRGRVGRSDRPAYAYLLVPKEAELSPIARRRLHAIQEFTELGSGFRIAALDLQIRGAGNVLGREQHGHIAAIGFDLYMDLLEQAVQELKGEGVEQAPTQVSLGLDVHVPEAYVEDVNQRLMVYKKVAAARTVAEVDEVGREIADRFGPPPRAVDNLLEAARLKIEAQERRIQAVEREGSRARLRFGPDVRLDPQALIAFVSGGKERKLHPDGRLEFPVTAGREATGEIRRVLGEIG
jgi:transcription-repair coupling factor (superfamily II helicase)